MNPLISLPLAFTMDGCYRLNVSIEDVFVTVTFNLPADIERILQREFADVGQPAKEAGLVELYRQRRITLIDFRRALECTRLEAEAVLHQHGVVEDLPTDSEYEAALAQFRISEQS